MYGMGLHWTDADPDTLIVGAGVRFERIRRITGYLVGTLDRFNDGKRAEERDRVNHISMIREFNARHAA